MIRVLETKLICIGRNNEDKFLEDIFLIKPESNIKGKVAHWKQMRYSPDDFKYSTEYRKHISCLSYELKTKDIAGNSKQPRHHIQKGQNEMKSDSEDEEVDTKFRISAMKIPLCPSRSLKYRAMLKEIKWDYFPEYLQPLPATRQKPQVKRETHEELKERRNFLASQRAGMDLHLFNDIDKYYSEQRQQEEEARKFAATAAAQVAQERARLNTSENLRKKISMARKLMQKDNETIQKGLRHIWKERLNYLEKVRERKSMFLAEKKLNAADQSLVLSLNNERSILLRGIIQVDKLKRDLSEMKAKHFDVIEKREKRKYKQNLLTEMKKLRAEEIHKRHCEERFVIDTLIFQKGCERLEEAKAKVEFINTYYTSKSHKKYHNKTMLNHI
ncbi:leucine-rich repeat and IQ domain-containing protein 3 isoform X1 [Rattus norvegicus]